MLVEDAFLCLQGQPVEQPHQMANERMLTTDGLCGNCQRISYIWHWGTANALSQLSREGGKTWGGYTYMFCTKKSQAQCVSLSIFSSNLNSQELLLIGVTQIKPEIPAIPMLKRVVSFLSLTSNLSKSSLYCE